MSVKAAERPATSTAGAHQDSSRSGPFLLWPILAALLVVSVVAAVSIGSVQIPVSGVWKLILSELPSVDLAHGLSAAEAKIVLDIRLPRVLLGAVVGAGLSVVGAILQAVVRNPLADPYLFGITAGASVGAVAVILLGLSAFGIYSMSVSAFLGALGAFTAVYLLARQRGALSPFRLILAGVAVGYVLSAVTSFLVFRSDAAGHGGEVRSVMFWLLGGLGGARWSYLGLPTLVVVVGTAYLIAQRRNLNALVIGDETAAGLGVDVRGFRRRLFALTSLITGVLVAVSGGIGFVGLMLPHIGRLMVGSDHRRLLPLVAVVGALFLVWVDVAARMVVAPSELPIGIITALVGGPFFLWLMRSRRTRSALAGG